MTKKNPAAQALGTRGGSANTPAQQQARRANAQGAGRPRRVCTGCGEPVHGWHKNRNQDATCPSHTWQWQKRRDR